ncbi:MAG: hypothetical protein IT488_05160 [Gammaproteobacteria bacterium]|nr:hypothetical protein [Gammaproteobacteria bacterium]
MNDLEQNLTAAPRPTEGLVALTYVIYGLHAFSAFNGLLSPAFIVTAFLTGWPSIIAVVINYLKRGDVRGTYLESHFRWQIRTFWFAAALVLLALLLALTLIGIPLAIAIAWLAGLWVLYRIVRGWLRLMNRQPMPL